jgi:hypothetical protein
MPWSVKTVHSTFPVSSEQPVVFVFSFVHQGILYALEGVLTLNA